MSKALLDRLADEVLVMSGATGTMLHGSGANLGGCIGQWILDHPAVYRDLVTQYFQAGCHIVSAATFSLNRISLAKYGLAGKMEEINRGLIRIIKEVRPEGRFVGGNLGPTGKMLKPLGEIGPEELLEVYREQAAVLADNGAELIYVLTMYDLEEAVIALKAAKKQTSLPVIVSLAFDPSPKGYRTMMGVSPEDAARRLEAEGADVIGANCGGIDLDQMAEVMGLMRAHCGKPLIAKPNAGSPRLVEGKEQYASGPAQFAGRVEKWIQGGARIVSACCGSGPDHLKEICREVQKLKPAPR